MFSVIIPVYRNADFVPDLIAAFESLQARIRRRFGIETEFVFVVDGSPDDSYALLQQTLPNAAFGSRLILHARNFGSFAAIRTGLKGARGKFAGVIAADLQEPPELLEQFLETLIADECDVVVGTRESRDDPAMTRLSAGLFWRLYRRWINRDIPAGGVDVFACNARFRDELVKLEEAHSSLIGLIFWLGFRRKEIAYVRRARTQGKSAWTLRKRVRYMLDSIFSFTDLPIQILLVLGAIGTAIALIVGLGVLILRVTGVIPVAGYAPTIIVIVFFGALNMLGLGLIGTYAWRTYENTKRRPLSIISKAQDFAPAAKPDALPAPTPETTS